MNIDKLNIDIAKRPAACMLQFLYRACAVLNRAGERPVQIITRARAERLVHASLRTAHRYM